MGMVLDYIGSGVGRVELRYRQLDAGIIRIKTAGWHGPLMVYRALLGRVNGIEPSSPAWEAGVMPLYDTRFEAF